MRWDWDYALHALGGLGLNSGLLGACIWASLPWWISGLLGLGAAGLLLGFGIAREKQQHHFDPLSAHQWREAVAWAIGGLLALPLVALR